ncbi:unnamed protein product [Schistosoma bovis]|nr:unnamed protein product [Schistosoma bovis]
MGRTIDLQNTLSVCYTNARSLRNKTSELSLMVQELCPDIIVVTETWFTVDIDCSPFIAGYICIRSDRVSSRKGGGIIFYVRDHFRIQSTISEAHISGTCEVACCKIKSRNGLVTIGGIYRSPSCLADDFILRHICSWSMAECCLIIGDFNAPHINWIELTAPGSGFDSDLLSTVIQCALVQCITKPTHIDLQHVPSLLDLALTHHSEDVFDIQHLPPLVNSDHVVIHFKFRTHGIQFVSAPPRPNIWRANIPEIRNRAILTDWSVDADGLIEDEWNKFKATFESVTSPFIPWSARKLSHCPPWINKETRKLLKRRKHFWDLFLLTGHAPFKREYQKYRNICKKTIAKSRTTYERQLVYDSRTCPKRLFSYVKRQMKRSDGIPPLLLHENSELLAESDRAKAETFSDYFSEVFSTFIVTNTCPTHTEIPTIESVQVTEETVLPLITNLKPGKIPGPDGLHPRLLSSLADIISKPLATLFNMSLSLAQLPRDWKDAIVSPIFKDGQRQIVSNYRPVSLTSIVVKLLEKIIRVRLLSHIDSHNLLAPEQHGFRNKRSCLTNLLIAREDWTAALDHGLSVDVIFIDFSKAFDKVSHVGLMQKLTSFGIIGTVHKWIGNFLCDRRQRVRVNGTLSDWKPVKSGVPQGTILGPLLFLLYVNELPLLLRSSTLLFADDVKIWRTIKSAADHLDLQADLDDLVGWAREWGLEINARKSVLMHVGHGNSYRYTIEGKPLPCVQEHKDLGVILSHDLKTTAHCKAAAVKGFRALWSLRRAFKSFDEETFRILYPIYVRPHLEYCIQAASPCLVKDTNSIERVQRVGTKLVKGLSRLPYDERLKRLNLFPLSYRRTRGDLILAFRIFNYDLGVNMSYLFAPSSTNNLRGHSKKVHKPRSNKLKVGSRFSHRVVNHWNALPEQVVSAPSVNTFKEKLDLHWKAMCQD